MRCPTLSELTTPPPEKKGWPWTEESPQLPDTMPGGQPWPKISIVTPSYNQGKFIEETIRSVLLQGYPSVEYTIIDGASSDNSVEIIKKYHKWLAYWVSEPDRGQSHAINKGFEKATGEIYAWLNSDDTYMPQAMETAVKFLSEHPDVGMVYGDGEFTNESGAVTQHYIVGEFDLKRMLCSYNHVPQPTAFFRSEVLSQIGYLDEGLHLAMDLDYWIRMGLKSKIAHIARVQATMRFHAGAKIPTQYSQAVYDHLRIVGKFYSNQSLPQELLQFQRQAYSEVHLRASKDFLSAGCRLEARKHFIKGVIRKPGYVFSHDAIRRLVRLLVGEKIAETAISSYRGLSRCRRRLLNKRPSLTPKEIDKSR